jgi:N-acetylated-alpha-linked acidic dipeptidase
MKAFSTSLLATVIVVSGLSNPATSRASDAAREAQLIFGFRDSAAEIALESRFMAVPDPKLAEQHLRILTQAPHLAGTPEDKATADYVAGKFREAGLQTEIVEYKVWFNYPSEISVDLAAPAGVFMHGPTPEHVDGDAFQDDPRIVTAYNSMSPSGDVEAEAVYANYGTPDDFDRLARLGVEVKGKIVIVRYGENFRGVKAFVAQERGAAGMIIYSDPADDGYRRGDKYPRGPWRPDTAVQRGSVGYIFEVPGDPTTPGIASVPELPDSQRIPPAQSPAMPKIPVTPLSYHDAAPILENLAGAETPREWQGALPFTYHLGPGPAKVKLHLKQDYQLRTIWDVIGRIPGAEIPAEMVVAGNHRDAWVYGAVDPNSGTAAMLETVHGIGDLLKSGWKPRRTIVFASWDAEEHGLMGSTEWAEQHADELAGAVAYFNMDAAVSGAKFGASAVPSLKQFVREVAKVVPSGSGTGSVLDGWMKNDSSAAAPSQAFAGPAAKDTAAVSTGEARVGDLGSGSDYTVFIQHLGIPSADIGSSGPYGVYHSAFDNFAWFKKFADPDFLYEQQMARAYGVEVLRMAQTDVLPYDYEEYGHEIAGYVEAARHRAELKLGTRVIDFSPAMNGARHFQDAGAKLLARQKNLPKDAAKLAVLNETLHQGERALLLPGGLPHRPWYRHGIYAPGEYTGYAAVVIPGVNEALDKGDADQARRQLAALAAALDHAVKVLEGAGH